MSEVYEDRDVTERREVRVGYRCDGCGHTSRFASDFITVRIEVHVDEEGGAADSYDYCDNCLVERAPTLRAAGSTAALVTPESVERSHDAPDAP